MQAPLFFYQNNSVTRKAITKVFIAFMTSMLMLTNAMLMPRANYSKAITWDTIFHCVLLKHVLTIISSDQLNETKLNSMKLWVELSFAIRY